MHKPSISVAIVMLSCAGTIAHSQAPQQSPLPQPPAQEQLAPSAKINLTLEQRHTIRELIKDNKADAASANVQAAVGEPVPQGISPKPMPAEVAQKVPQVKAHRFFLTTQQIVIVDPKDNKVSEVIKIETE
jgi:Protein of unknown function (DUF1236)